MDGGEVRESLQKALKPEDVATSCIHAVDREMRTVFLPQRYWLAPLLYWTVPSIVDSMARKKYNFTAS